MIAVARRVGDRVRVAPGARGERTGGFVGGREGVVADTMPEHWSAMHECYWVRFDVKGLTIAFDWIAAEDLWDR